MGEERRGNWRIERRGGEGRLRAARGKYMKGKRG